jgi:hypothetical protein
MGNQVTEHSEQAAFVSEVLYRYSNDPTFIRGLFFSTFNGAWLAGNIGARARQMQKAKEAGFLPGIADILYLQPRGLCAYLAIEMKSASGKLSPAQDAFLICARQAGGQAWVCRGASHAVGVFEDYMKLEVTA